MTPKELNESQMWFHGPLWLRDSSSPVTTELEESLPSGCLEELRVKERDCLTLSVIERGEGKIGSIMSIERFSSIEKLITCTAYVILFIDKLKQKSSSPDTAAGSREENVIRLSLPESYKARAEILWIQEAQRGSIKSDWRAQFMLYLDNEGVCRCGGRLGHSDLPYHTRYPILLPRTHHFSLLVVRRAHQRVIHFGVKDTLTEVRSRYWIPQGQVFVRQYISRCVVCRRYSASSYKPPPPPPLPEFRVQRSFPFSAVGVDYAGPLMIKQDPYKKEKQNTYVTCNGKAWVCLFTCCVTRAVHIELVTNLSSQSFLGCFKRFISRRGLPSRIISDNGSTFKLASRYLKSILEHPEVQHYMSGINVKWSFNIERAPWWGGFFERMIQLLKKCLRKLVGQAKLTYEELLTGVTEVELILNSRPLSYVTTDDFEEPLTPSHLINGRRLLNLPDHLCHTEPEEFNPDSSRQVLKQKIEIFEYYFGTLLESLEKRVFDRIKRES